MVELTQSVSVKFESRPTGGETGHEDVDVDLHWVGLVNVSVHDLHHFVVGDALSLEVHGVVVQQVVQSGFFFILSGSSSIPSLSL